jgi:hypothetical protein
MIDKRGSVATEIRLIESVPPIGRISSGSPARETRGDTTFETRFNSAATALRHLRRARNMSTTPKVGRRNLVWCVENNGHCQWPAIDLISLMAMEFFLKGHHMINVELSDALH